MKIIFLGDIALNHRYEEMSDNPFVDFDGLLSSADYVVGNLECMSYGKGFNENKFPRLGTDANTLRRLLPFTYCNLVTLAHNHCYDNLDDGFEKTLSTLAEMKISAIGAGLDSVPNYYVLENNDIKVCFLNYVHENTHPSRPDHTRIQQSVYDKKKILFDISHFVNDVDHIVLLFHWGGDNEGYMYPNLSQLSDAKSFIEAGASLIVGGHSHTLQPYEVYNGKHIYYSLGNFCFDDTHCDGHVNVRKPKEKESMILQVDFRKDTYNCRHVFIRNENLHLHLSNTVEKKWQRRNAIFKLIFFSKYSYNFYFMWSRYIKKVFKYALSPSLIYRRLFSSNKK